MSRFSNLFSGLFRFWLIGVDFLLRVNHARKLALNAHPQKTTTQSKGKKEGEKRKREKTATIHSVTFE
jgi:hypothetical protein